MRNLFPTHFKEGERDGEGGGSNGQLDMKGDIDISGIVSPNLQSNIFG